MKAKDRGKAHFTVEDRSSVLRGQRVTWRVEVSTQGIVAHRKDDGRRVAIGWRELIGIAMFYGFDSARGDRQTSWKREGDGR